MPSPAAPLHIAVVKETAAHERRVALTPDSARRFAKLGVRLSMEPGAGEAAAFADAAYRDAGVELGVPWAEVDIVLCVQPPPLAQLKGVKSGAAVIGMLSPQQNLATLNAWAAAGLDAFAMEWVPRITRAQSMDVVSSQSNLAGYKAVLDAAAEYGGAFPMMMTAAGTVPAARVFVLGAGVAGLQAIATAKRLGAIVSATDVRRAAGEQVESLGAKFVAVEGGESGETASGYAKEMSADYLRQQAALVAEHLKSQNIAICTALVFGRRAPVLISRAMVDAMQPGSVIVDLAAEQGGNCACTEPGKIVEHKGVRIIGHLNVPSRLAANASALYARNLYQFCAAFHDAESGALRWPDDDEIVQAVRCVHGGRLVHPALQTEKKQGDQKQEDQKQGEQKS